MKVTVDEDNTLKEPTMPVTCVTNRHRYSWRKWLRCWRDTQESNKERKRLAAVDEVFKPDIFPAWTPTWKKRDGSNWKLELDSQWEFLMCFEERENGKTEWNGRPPYADWNDDEDGEWSDMSDPIQVWSSDESFDSSKDYNSDF